MEEFNTQEELKQRITPAIQTKINELKSYYYENVTEDDIWEYLKNIWKKQKDLTLYDIVNDILSINNEEINEFSIKRRNEND